MARGRRYEPREDEAITRAVERGARLEGDFAELALTFGRPKATLRRRAIKLGLLTERVRIRSGPAPIKEWTEEEDERVREMRARGWSLRNIGGVLGRSGWNVRDRLAVLDRAAAAEREGSDDPAPAQTATEASLQARACERHAAACLAAGGFWALSERRLGRDQVAVCLPLVPPVQMRGAPR